MSTDIWHSAVFLYILYPAKDPEEDFMPKKVVPSYPIS